MTYPYYLGPIPSWAAAVQASTGWSEMLERAEAAMLKVLAGEAVYAVDGIVFDRVQYSWPATAALMLAAARGGGTLNVLDFGGDLGSHYHQHREFLKSFSSVRWSVVEQPALVERATPRFETPSLRFHSSVDAALAASRPGIALLSGVLQYLPDPYETLADVARRRIPLLVVDRTLIGIKVPDVIALQRVPVDSYNPPLAREGLIATRFLDADRIVAAVSPPYRLVAAFQSATSDFPDDYAARGFIFELPTEPQR